MLPPSDDESSSSVLNLPLPSDDPAEDAHSTLAENGATLTEDGATSAENGATSAENGGKSSNPTPVLPADAHFTAESHAPARPLDEPRCRSGGGELSDLAEPVLDDSQSRIDLDDEQQLNDLLSRDVERWVAAVQENQGKAFKELIGTYSTYLLMLARNKLPSHLSKKIGASDLVQEVLVKAMEGVTKFKSESPAALQGWLRTILSNHLRDVIRYFDAEMRSVKRECSVDHAEIGARDYRLDDASKQILPSCDVERLEEADRLGPAMEQLSPDEQQAITLHSLQHMAFESVGTLMGRSADSARRLWAKAVERLQAQLGDDS